MLDDSCKKLRHPDEDIVQNILQEMENTRALYQSAVDPKLKIIMASRFRTLEGRILDIHLNEERLNFFVPADKDGRAKLMLLVTLAEAHRVALCNECNKRIVGWNPDPERASELEGSQTDKIVTRFCHELRFINGLHEIIEESEVSLPASTVISWFGRWNKILSVVNQLTTVELPLELPVRVPLSTYQDQANKLKTLLMLKSVTISYHPDPEEFFTHWMQNTNFPKNDFDSKAASKFFRKRWKAAQEEALQDAVKYIES